MAGCGELWRAAVFDVEDMNSTGEQAEERYRK